MMAWESLLSESQTSNLTMAQNETSPFAPIFFLAYKKESIDYFSSVSSSSIQHYLRKKINKIE